MTDQLQQVGTLDSALRDVCTRLDDCARQIREIPLEPKEALVLKVGTALSQLYDIFDAIYTVRPDLKPEWLDSESRLQ